MRPRQILPGATYLVTRRCTQRQFLLTPTTRQHVQAFAYCLAYAAIKTGVYIHAVIVMGNHYHIVVTDPHGVLPVFAELLNKLVAKCIPLRVAPDARATSRLVTEDRQPEQVAPDRDTGPLRRLRQGVPRRADRMVRRQTKRDIPDRHLSHAGPLPRPLRRSLNPPLTLPEN